VVYLTRKKQTKLYTMKNLPTINCDIFKNAEVCFDPANVLGEDWNGTALDILDHPQIPSEDKIWAVCAKGALPESVQRLMAVAFVRETPLHDGRNVVDLATDERSVKALEVAELHALGRATDGELDAARGAAKDAASSPAGAAAWAATWDATWDAAWEAAGDAAQHATRSATRHATRSATSTAAWVASRAASRDAAWAAAWDAQVEIARRVILPGHAE